MLETDLWAMCNYEIVALLRVSTLVCTDRVAGQLASATHGTHDLLWSTLALSFLRL